MDAPGSVSYCVVFNYLYSASLIMGISEMLPARATLREKVFEVRLEEAKIKSGC